MEISSTATRTASPTGVDQAASTPDGVADVGGQLVGESAGALHVGVIDPGRGFERACRREVTPLACVHAPVRMPHGGDSGRRGTTGGAVRLFGPGAVGREQRFMATCGVVGAGGEDEVEALSRIRPSP